MRTFLESANKTHLRFVAKTPRERFRGLMFQPPLLPNEAALFVYDTPTKGSFWNKNVDFPIQIGFFDQQRKLIAVRRLEAQQQSSVGPNKEYRYALETSDGFFDAIPEGTLLDSLLK